jgi:hypothetical protein
MYNQQFWRFHVEEILHWGTRTKWFTNTLRSCIFFLQTNVGMLLPNIPHPFSANFSQTYNSRSLTQTHGNIYSWKILGKCYPEFHAALNFLCGHDLVLWRAMYVIARCSLKEILWYISSWTNVLCSCPVFETRVRRLAFCHVHSCLWGLIESAVNVQSPGSAFLCYRVHETAHRLTPAF